MTMDCVPNVQMPPEIKSEAQNKVQNDENLLMEMPTFGTESTAVKEEFHLDLKVEPPEDNVPPEFVITVKNEPYVEAEGSAPMTSFESVTKEEPQLEDSSDPIDDSTLDPAPSDLHCVKCNRSFVTVDSYELHCAMHYKTVCGLHRCRYCQEVFRWKSELARHQQHCKTDVLSRMEAIQEGELFICPKCFQSFAIREFCINHINRHNRLSVWEDQSQENDAQPPRKSKDVMKCPECPKLFKRQVNFDQHLSVHRDAKLGLYKCKICGKVNKSNVDLTRHSLKVHGKFQMAPSSTTEANVEIRRKRKHPMEIGTLSKK